jgi:hypothetical protein
LYNWIKCVNGSLKYVRRDLKGNEKENETDREKFSVIYDEY